MNSYFFQPHNIGGGKLKRIGLFKAQCLDVFTMKTKGATTRQLNAMMVKLHEMGSFSVTDTNGAVLLPACLIEIILNKRDFIQVQIMRYGT